MARGGLYIKINLREQRLYLYQGERLYGSYKVAIGKPSTPTPIGKWTIVNKSILKGGTVFGTRWMGLSNDSYGIHGNNNPSAIGKAVSLGCVRMYNEDVEHIYPLVPIGTEVEIFQDIKTGNKPSKAYIVKSGDTLWNIARRFGLSLQDLIKLNPSIDPDNIHPGQTILLP